MKLTFGWWYRNGPYFLMAFSCCFLLGVAIFPAIIARIDSIQERELLLQKQKFEMRATLLDDYRTMCIKTDVCAPYWDLQKEMKESLK